LKGPWTFWNPTYQYMYVTMISPMNNNGFFRIPDWMSSIWLWSFRLYEFWLLNLALEMGLTLGVTSRQEMLTRIGIRSNLWFAQRFLFAPSQICISYRTDGIDVSSFLCHFIVKCVYTCLPTRPIFLLDLLLSLHSPIFFCIRKYFVLFLNRKRCNLQFDDDQPRTPCGLIELWRREGICPLFYI
jgi:hypothetical protein